jgi:hypothetical protein
MRAMQPGAWEDDAAAEIARHLNTACRGTAADFGYRTIAAGLRSDGRRCGGSAPVTIGRNRYATESRAVRSSFRRTSRIILPEAAGAARGENICPASRVSAPGRHTDCLPPTLHSGVGGCGGSAL